MVHTDGTTEGGRVACDVHIARSPFFEGTRSGKPTEEVHIDPSGGVVERGRVVQRGDAIEGDSRIVLRVAEHGGRVVGIRSQSCESQGVEGTTVAVDVGITHQRHVALIVKSTTLTEEASTVVDEIVPGGVRIRRVTTEVILAVKTEPVVTCNANVAGQGAAVVTV